MSSSGPQFDPAHTSLRAFTRTLQPEMLPLCNPTWSPNAIITQFLTSIPLLVDYLSLFVCIKLYLAI